MNQEERDRYRTDPMAFFKDILEKEPPVIIWDDVEDDREYIPPNVTVIQMRKGKGGVFEFDHVLPPRSVWDASTHINEADGDKYEHASINVDELRKMMDGIGWILKRGRR